MKYGMVSVNRDQNLVNTTHAHTLSLSLSHKSSRGFMLFQAIFPRTLTTFVIVRIKFHKFFDNSMTKVNSNEIQQISMVKENYSLLFKKAVAL